MLFGTKLHSITSQKTNLDIFFQITVTEYSGRNSLILIPLLVKSPPKIWWPIPYSCMSKTNIPTTSGVFAACRCSVLRCSWSDGSANITSLVWFGSCSLLLLLLRDLCCSEELSSLSLSRLGNRSTAANKLYSQFKYLFYTFLKWLSDSLTLWYRIFYDNLIVGQEISYFYITKGSILHS